MGSSARLGEDADQEGKGGQDDHNNDSPDASRWAAGADVSPRHTDDEVGADYP